MVSCGALEDLFRQNKLEELKLLHTLYSPITDGLKIVAEKFKMLIIEMGLTCVDTRQSAKKDKLGQEQCASIRDLLITSNLVENLVTLQKKIQRMTKYSFNSDSAFVRQMQLGFQAFMNLDVG